MTTVAASQKRRTRVRAPHPALVVAGLYVLFAIFVNLRVWIAGPTSHVQFAGGDLATYIWSLRWVPFAVFHGHSPFFTSWINYPNGVNLLDNTGSILLGLIGSPITYLFGPIATLNVMQTAAFATSAIAGYIFIRQFVKWEPAAFLGGLLYGFSPYMVAAGWAHLPLIFIPMPPLILLCLYELAVRQAGDPIRWGALLALFMVCQFFLSPELLADTVEFAGVALLVLVVSKRELVRDRVRHAAVGLGFAVSTVGLVLAYPAWYLVAGPQHVRILTPSVLFSSDLLSPFTPTRNQLLSPSPLRRVSDHFSYLIPFMGHSYELTNVAYLGVPLILFLVWVVFRYRREVWAWMWALLGILSFVASLGPRLKIDGHVSGVRLPALILEHVPLLRTTAPYRYSVFAILSAAVLLAIGLERIRYSNALGLSARCKLLTSGAVVVVVLLPLVPALPYRAMPVALPPVLRSPSVVPSQGVLLEYPFPGPFSAITMAWQAIGDFRYRMVGGYAFVPDGRGSFTLSDGAGVTQGVLDAMYRGLPIPPDTPLLHQQIAKELRDWRITVIVVDLNAYRAANAVTLLAAVVGRAPLLTKGAAVWLLQPP